jgi:hypothetical protein
VRFAYADRAAKPVMRTGLVLLIAALAIGFASIALLISNNDRSRLGMSKSTFFTLIGLDTPRSCH